MSLLDRLESARITREAPDHVSTWKHEIAERIALGELAPKTYNNAVGVLSACLEWARDHRYLKGDPLPKKLRTRRAQKNRAIIEGAAIARLWHAASGQDKVIVALALYCGLRRAEIFGLDWSAVTWPRGRVRASVRVEQTFGRE